MAGKPYHVFLSYSRIDACAVEAIANRLVNEEGLRPFLDTWHLVPGEPWQEELEKALTDSETCAVFIGALGLGTWEHEEMRAAIDARVKNPEYRVIPVLLPGASIPDRGQLPRFLTRLTWVDFRRSQNLQDDGAFHRLVAGIRGEAPGALSNEVYGGELECPYQGLKVFDEASARFFFGREALAQHLIESLRKRTFLAVLGPSGSGKSSVIRAGLLPQLRTGALPASASWQYHLFKPGAHPLQELALTLMNCEQGTQTPARVLDLLASFSADERALHIVVRQQYIEQPQTARCCLIVDQFEEIFTLCHDREERIHFIDLLRYAATIGGGQTIVVITLRADFMARAAEYIQLAELLSGNEFIISPMNEADLRRAIEEPARRMGAHFEEGLVDAILNDAGHEPGMLPLMEHALFQLWEKRERDHRLTLQAYQEMGGLRGALANQAEKIFKEFSPQQQDLTRRVLLRLTQPGEGTEDTRRRATMSELDTGKDQQTALQEVIHQLTEARLLVMSQNQVDVAHEALIRGWPRLRKWIDEGRTALRLHRRITETVQEWERLQRDDGVLLRGASLAEAQEWRERHDADLNSSEREFLIASTALIRREEQAVREHKQRESSQAQALADEQARRAREQARSMKHARWFVGGILAIAMGSMMLARQTIRQKEIATGDRLLAEADSIVDQQPDLALLLSVESIKRRTTWEARSNLLSELQTDRPAILTGILDAVLSIAFSPDGQILASASADNNVRLWDVAGRKPLGAPLTGHTDIVISVAFSPDGKTLASGSADKTIRLWDVASRQSKMLTGHSGNVLTLAFSPDGQMLASGSADKTIRLWNLASHVPLGAVLTGHMAEVHSLAFRADGKALASASSDGTIRMWDVASRRQSGVPLAGHKNTVSSVLFSADGRILVSAGADRTVRWWDVATREEIGAPQIAHKDAVLSLAISPDGKILASASRDSTIRLWDMTSHQPVGNPLIGHTNIVPSVTFSPDGRTIASASFDNTIRLWNINNRQSLSQVLPDYSGDLGVVAFSADGEILAVAGHDHTIRLWNVKKKQAFGRPLIGHSDSISSLAFSPDGKTLASASDDKTIQLWNLEICERRGLPLRGPTDRVLGLLVSHDGNVVAAAADKSIWLWDNNSHLITDMPVTSNTGRAVAVAFSPDGDTLARADADNSISMVSIHNGKVRNARFLVHTDTVRGLAFSPNGKLLASSNNKIIRLWDVASNQPLGVPFVGHTDSVMGIAFSPNGEILASASIDNTIRLWNVATRQPLGGPLTGHTDKVINVIFSPDGKTLAATSSDRSISLWDLDVNSWVARACRIVDRDLTINEWNRYVGAGAPRPTCSGNSYIR